MLNLEQKEAVSIVDRPLIVIAGPGTGKTTLITEKINFLLEEKKFSEDEILAITFTRKAAFEMSERVEARTNKAFFAKTFHEFCLSIIEEYQKEIAHIDKDYILINEVNSLLFFLENLNDFNLKSVEIKNNQSTIAYELSNMVSKLKDFGIRLSDLEKLKVEDVSTKMDIFIVYSKYETYKKQNNYIDYSDLLLLVLDLLKDNKKIRDEIVKKYKYILVDEFQDTNKVQLEILKLITDENNITIVGDQKQSIYSFRGSNFQNLEDFKSHFKNYFEVFLHENYRSSKKVLENINSVVEVISDKKQELSCTRDEIGTVNLIEAQSERAQLSFIAQKISNLLDKDPNLKIGVLCRRKFELKIISSYLKNLGLDFNSNETENFFNYELIKSILNVLKIINSPKESNNEFFKFFLENSIREESIRKIYRNSSLKEDSMYKVISKEKICDYEDDNLIINNLYLKLEKLIGLKNSKCSLYELIHEVLFTFNFYQNAMFKKEDNQVFILNNFLNFAKEYSRIYRNSDLSNFLKVCSYTKSLEFSFNLEFKSSVELLTIHSSKGKEFDYVFMPYLNDRKFPATFQKSKFDVFNLENRENYLEEEKRLFFVGISRAKLGLNLLFVKRFDDNKLDSKPSNLIEILKLKKESFAVEFEDIKIPKKEQERVDLISSIRDNLLNNNFETAKKLIDEMRIKFGKKDLNFFISGSSSNDSKINKKVDFSNHIYSVSQIKMYEQCPRKYEFSYVYKIPTLPKSYFDFGTSLHSVFENIVNDIKKYSKEVLFAKGISDLRKNWISKGYENFEQEKEYFEKGVNAIKIFIDRELELEKDGRIIESREEKFIIEIEGKKLLGFIDRVDLVNGEYEIIDYKTSNSMESERELKENLQLFVYSFALKNLKGKYPQKVGLWYVIHDKIVNVEIKDINIEKQKEKVVKLISLIEKNNFVANPSFFNCKYCDYSEICKDSK